ncbi:hypothetical protein ACIPIN_05525 [Pseudomonas sp. NPDC087697]|uniref:hypothetical protein n=1 Tax=Pseudomonas sp. NPDC087697 TaxID=3364447 RepID=UPI0037F8A1BE
MKSRMKLSLAMTCLITAGFTAHLYADNDTFGTQISAQVTANYADTRDSCGSYAQPAFACSGVIIRSTRYSDAYRSWEPSAKHKSAGAVSFSYLRADSKFNEMAGVGRNGFIRYPDDQMPAGMNGTQVICAFPIDGGSDERQVLGCDDSNLTPEFESSCQQQSITTAEQWYAFYVKNNKSHHRQCAFDVLTGPTGPAAKEFIENLRAMQYIQDESFGSLGKSNNELRIATWADGLGKAFPVMSFFYIEGGLEAAQKDQKAFHADTGRFVPILNVTLPRSPSEDATFTYLPSDQLALNDRSGQSNHR